VLLVSTDPASNLSEVLATEIGEEPAAVKDTANLLAMNVDPEAAAVAYWECAVGEARIGIVVLCGFSEFCRAFSRNFVATGRCSAPARWTLSASPHR
jgi:hypothetical protein